MGNDSSSHEIPKTSYVNNQRNLEESSSSDECLEGEPQMGMANLEQDAVQTQPAPDLIAVSLPQKLNILDHLDEIFKDLDDYEKVSLVFLLYEVDPDQVHLVYQEMLLMSQGGRKNVLRDWVNNEMKKNDRWEDKLIEALAILQNFCILKHLGYSKEECKSRFLPHSLYTSLQINITKKILYILFENMGDEETSQFLQYVQTDFQRKRIKFVGHKFMELCFLHWITVRFVEVNHEQKYNLAEFLKIVKLMGKLDFYEELKKQCIAESNFVGIEGFTEGSAARQPVYGQTIARQIGIGQLPIPSGFVEENSDLFDPSQREYLGTLVPTMQQQRLNIDKTSMQSGGGAECTMILKKHKVSDVASYPINEQKPGYCVIINQVDFYRLHDRRHEIPERVRCHALEQRVGSEKDVVALEQTFGTICGMKVIVHTNKTDSEMEEVLAAEVANAVDYSSLFVCILSHGQEGEVFGTNSIPMKISKMKELMYRFVQKPKVLIIQACQGSNLIQIEPKSTLATDGPGSCDKDCSELLVFYATVPGYGAVRDTETGTWFIQTLCKEMKEHIQEEHFEDICTRVKLSIGKYKWEKGGMVALTESTFRKFLYLPSVEN